MEQKLKLNVKRTTFIGLAFFTILMLWQVYNYYAPLFLQDILIAKFGGKSTDYAYIIGAIMAADNLFGLFMLPIFGNLSDKTNTKYGKRMPFIVVGTVLAAIIFPLIPVFYLNNSLVGIFVTMGLTLLVMNMYIVKDINVTKESFNIYVSGITFVKKFTFSAYVECHLST